MKHEAVKVMGGARGFLGLVVVFALQASEQKTFDSTVHNDLCVSFEKASFNQQFTNINTVDDITLPMLFRGDLSPANAAYTITRPGIYTLTSAKTASGIPNIYINANNVTLDLGGNTLTGGTNGIEILGNNVTVANGTITGMTHNGVLVQGVGCRVDNCDVTLCTTGITLQSSYENVVENCRVRNITRAGVSLQNTWTSSVSACEISGIHGISSVYGVYAANGGNNSVEQCVIHDLQTNSSTVGDEVGGIVFYQDQNSYVGDNSINSVISLGFTSSAYGILFYEPSSYTDMANLPSSPGASYPQVAFDVYGNAIIVWESSSSIYFARFNSGGSLVTPGTIAGSSGGYDAQIAFDGFGNALTVWTNGSQTYAARYTFGVGWDTGQSLGSVGGYPPQIAVAQDGTGLALWSNGSNIYSARYVVGSGWESAQVIGSAQYYYAPPVLFDTYGNALALWYDEANGKIYSALYSASSGWSGAVEIPGTSNAYFPSLAVDCFGNAWAVWEQIPSNSSIYYARYQVGLGWGTAVQIPGTSSTNSTGAKVITNSVGDALALWTQNDGSNDQIYFSWYKLSTGNWTSIAKLPEQMGSNASNVELTIDSQDNVFATWVQNAGLDDLIYSSRYVSGLGWSDSLLLSPGGGQINRYPQVSSDKIGNAFFVWRDDSTNIVDYIRYNAAYGVGNIIENNINKIRSNNSFGVGLFAPNRLIVSNTVLDTDISFASLAANKITSQANARGVYNIDTSLTTSDVVSLIVDQALTVESKLDLLVPEVETIESKLDYLTACDYQALPAPTTLSTDYGAYCLSADMSGDIAITGAGITLCLNGHTITGGTNGILVSGDEAVIKNGTVRNTSASGIKITGNKCLLEDITAVSNVTGFELNGADNTVLKSCMALDNTREGFLLTNAQKNSFEQCEAINTSGAGTVAGFKTTGGTGNRFIDCKVNGVTSSDEQAYGVLGLHEIQARIDDTSVMNIAGTSYVAGVGLIGDYLGTPTAQDFSSNGVRQSRNIDWLNSSVGSYIATANSIANAARSAQVDLFSPTTGINSIGVTGTLADYLYRVKWLTWQNDYYLAIIGYGGGAGVEIIVYIFDQAVGTFTSAGTFQYTTAASACLGGDWVISGTIPYLLYTGGYNATAGVQELGALSYNGATLTKVSGIDFPASIFPYNVDAHLVNGKWKVAVTGVDGSSVTKPLVEIYTFDDPQGTALLQLTVNFDIATAGQVLHTSWLDYEGQTYLAIGITDNASAPTVRVLKYTDSPEALSEFATYDYGAGVQGVDWLVTGTTAYLAVSGDLANNRTAILSFDPYQGSTTTRLSNYYVCSAENQQGYDLHWNRINSADNSIYLAIGKNGGASTPYLRVYGFDVNDQSKLSLISNTEISGVPGGDGLLVDPVVNSVYNVTAFNCQDGLQQVVRTGYVPQQSFYSSNRAVPSI